ncbi:MAG: RNA polymerase sigma factor [Candidatus Aminicenantes bacterium]|nr:RNA polymerase sigma factor [Candidatus Aminicenantes bacterium]
MELIQNYELRLVKQASHGDRNAFREIVEDNKKKIFYLAFDFTGSIQDAEDLSQDVFIKAFRSLHTFKGEASISTWLYRITLNTFLDLKRKKSFEMEKNQAPLDEGVSANPVFPGNPSAGNPETYAESRQMQMHIQQALETLSPRERSVFVMRHYRGMPGKTVGELLNISEGTVKSLLSRAIKKLQNALGFYRDSLDLGMEVQR